MLGAGKKLAQCDTSFKLVSHWAIFGCELAEHGAFSRELKSSSLTLGTR